MKRKSDGFFCGECGGSFPNDEMSSEVQYLCRECAGELDDDGMAGREFAARIESAMDYESWSPADMEW
jgi:hypothetical protein